MSVSTRDYHRPSGFNSMMPPGVKMLLIANFAVFILQFFGGRALAGWFAIFALYPIDVVQRFFIWQPATYLFLHGGIGHILWNMLALWMFGRELEGTWGTRTFLRFYFFCGIGAGFVVVAAHYAFGNPAQGTIGASGAIYGLLMASAVLWPDRIMLFNFLIPLKMKYYVMIIGVLALFGALNVNSGVSEVAHLSGMGFAYLLLKMPRVRGIDPMAMLKERYRQWKLARAKRRFQVYLRKKGTDRGPWVQ